MDPGSKQDGGVVNMTRAMEALCSLLKHSRRTITKVEVLVLFAAGLLLSQLVLGCCKRRWHNSKVKLILQVPSKLMNPLILYALGTMQSSPIKNSSYPVWAAFLIMASAGTTAIQQYDFCGSSANKIAEGLVESIKYLFYVYMFLVLLDPNQTTWNVLHSQNASASSYWVYILFFFVVVTRLTESIILAMFVYKRKRNLFFPERKKTIHRAQHAERTEETANDRGSLFSSNSTQSMKGYKYQVCFRRTRLTTIDQIWDCCGNSVYDKTLKDLCLSCALFRRLVRRRYFGEVLHKSSLRDHDFVFKILLPSEGDFKRAFKIIEVELGFCYDFFFTKHCYISEWMNIPFPVFQFLVLGKIILILAVGVLAIRKSLVLETPSPIVEVHISEADWIITLVVLGVAFIVELMQAMLYLASDWAQVSLGCMYVRKLWCEPKPIIFKKVIGFLRRVMISGQLRNKVNQHSVIFGRKQQPKPVEVSDAVKRAVARSLISKYGNNLVTNGETSLWHNKMFGEYFWAIKDLSQLEVMFIWHIATEYCDISSPTHSSRTTGGCPCSKHRGFADHLFGYVPQLLPNNKGNKMTHHDIHRGVAVHLSRYCAYLIGKVPELLPYHQADIAELAEKVVEDRRGLFGSYGISMFYSKMKNLEGTKEEDDPRKIFQKGVKLGKQLKRLPDRDCWELLEDFWAETIIHAAKSHYTTKQHMEHLENGGEFLTHIWALLAHAGILNLDWGKDQEGQSNPGSSL